MRVAGSSLIHSEWSLSDACRDLADLGFDAVDVATAEDWAHVNPSETVGAVDETVARIDAACGDAGLDPVAFNAVFGDYSVEEQAEQAAALAQVGEEIGVDVACVDSAPKDESLEGDFDRFRALVDAVEPYDFTLAFEAHYHFHSEDPAVALRYVEEVPGLAITLDLSHFAAGEFWDGGDGYDPLLPHVAHVHLRQARPGEPQVLDGEGVIDFGDVIGKLRDAGYDGALAVEYHDGHGLDPDDVAATAAALREDVTALLAAD